MRPSLVAKGLCYEVDGISLLNDISLEFSPGSLYAILGPNGSGKTTLLKAVTGIWKLTSGTVLWNGEPLLDRDRRTISRIITLVSHNIQPAFDFLVEDIVAMGKYSRDTRYWNAKDTILVRESLEAVDMWKLRRRKITQLSQGERQRVYIARALVTESPVLFLDEPTASLDIRHQLDIWKLLRQCVESGKIVVVTTHDLALAERFCESGALLNNGSCVGSGPIGSLMRPENLQEVFGVASSQIYAGTDLKSNQG